MNNRKQQFLCDTLISVSNKKTKIVIVRTERQWTEKARSNQFYWFYAQTGNNETKEFNYIRIKMVYYMHVLCKKNKPECVTKLHKNTTFSASVLCFLDVSWMENEQKNYEEYWSVCMNLQGKRKKHDWLLVYSSPKKSIVPLGYNSCKLHTIIGIYTFNPHGFLYVFLFCSMIKYACASKMVWLKGLKYLSLNMKSSTKDAQWWMFGNCWIL